MDVNGTTHGRHFEENLVQWCHKEHEKFWLYPKRTHTDLEQTQKEINNHENGMWCFYQYHPPFQWLFSRWTWVIRFFLGFLPSLVPEKNRLEYVAQVFTRPDAFHITQLKHWRKQNRLTHTQEYHPLVLSFLCPQQGPWGRGNCFLYAGSPSLVLQWCP